jgi:ElaB/YqjD/DUF883 family membrane-anchored ribosome-binding protein
MTRQRAQYPPNYDNGARNTGERANDIAEAVTDRFMNAADDAQGKLRQVTEQALRYAEMAQDAVRQFKPFVEKSIKEKPMATLASFVLAGFVLGALWKK